MSAKSVTLWGEALDDCISILRRDHLVYLHCFDGPRKIVEMFLEHFPNLKVRVSSLTVGTSSEAVKMVALEGILLETETPMFPRSENREKARKLRQSGRNDRRVRHLAQGNPTD